MFLVRKRAALLATACLMPGASLSPALVGHAWAQGAGAGSAGSAVQGPPMAEVPVRTLPARRVPEARNPDAARPGRTGPGRAPGQDAPGREAARRGARPVVRREGGGDPIRAISIEGSQRIEQGTIRSYMLVQTGDAFGSDRVDRSLRTLYATGLFKDVSIHRTGTTLVVRVVENPLVNQIAFEGNSSQKDDVLRPVLQLRPRAVYTPQLVQADRQRLLDLYAKHSHYAATVEPQIIRLPQNRVDVIFRINEGSETLVSRITFVGNHAYSETRLREEVSTREQAWFRFLSSADQYDPERINYDKELLRRFYLRNGYADFEASSATSELSPDRKSFFVTFTIHEGERYHVGTVKVDSQVAHLSSDKLLPLVAAKPGDIYNGDAVQRSTTLVQNRAVALGFPFVEVNPRVARDKEKRTVDLLFDVVNGPRVFVERIDISGNTVTRDNVIRREFALAEGDAYGDAASKATKQRLTDLGYFSSVNITTSPGSSADRVVVNAAVAEKATGELTLGGGFSTDAGVLGQAGLRQRNLVGTGIDANLSGTLAQRESQVNLSATDPYFLDRNLVAGADIYLVNNNNLNIANYSEQRIGASFRLGYQFNDHLAQAWTYTITSRDVNNVNSTASIYVQDEAGRSLLSMIGQTLALDYRDSRSDAHTGFIAKLGTDFAGLGGDAKYARVKLDATYFIPLDFITGNSDWGVAVSGSGGYLATLGGRERIIDRFFLGGDNLRGFQDGGVGPHSVPVNARNGNPAYLASDALGGEVIYTQSTELHFPLPISADLGLSGRAFVDVGGLEGLKQDVFTSSRQAVGTNDFTPRVGTGVGVSWKSPFGLINVDLGYPVVRQKYDRQQIFRFGFGTRF
jgi:outer membrane protein insertion porin family